MSLTGRPITLPDDLAAVVDLTREYETHWFGAPENDADEIEEELARVEHTTLVFDGDRPVAYGWWQGHDSVLTAGPEAPPEARVALLDWITSSGAPSATALSRDTAMITGLHERGWRHLRSSFELLRAVGAGWVLDEPVWPAGVEPGLAGAQDAEAVHRLIYDDAGWASVPGHARRDLDEWRSIFFTEAAIALPPLVARRGGQLVGVALGRVFSDGTGFVTQLAVATGERGHGLGRALLLEGLRRFAAAGAVRLGLSVQGENRGALRLYLGVGLELDREWQTFEQSH